jgi:hypothetical protein
MRDVAIEDLDRGLDGPVDVQGLKEYSGICSIQLVFKL